MTPCLTLSDKVKPLVGLTRVSLKIFDYDAVKRHTLKLFKNCSDTQKVALSKVTLHNCHSDIFSMEKVCM